MLYSIVPPETVWSGEAVSDRGWGEEWVPLGRGCLVCLHRGPDGVSVSRLVSTEPRHYLDPWLQPGCPWRGPAGPAPRWAARAAGRRL